jgi:hypothetical protein
MLTPLTRLPLTTSPPLYKSNDGNVEDCRTWDTESQTATDPYEVSSSSSFEILPTPFTRPTWLASVANMYGKLDLMTRRRRVKHVPRSQKHHTWSQSPGSSIQDDSSQRRRSDPLLSARNHQSKSSLLSYLQERGHGMKLALALAATSLIARLADEVEAVSTSTALVVR